MGRSPGYSKLIRVVPTGTAESVFAFLVKEAQELHQRHKARQEIRGSLVEDSAVQRNPLGNVCQLPATTAGTNAREIYTQRSIVQLWKPVIYECCVCVHT
jgi:hypothetical protein